MTCSTEGDIGDSCYILAVLAALPGGPHTLTVTPSQWTKIKTDADADRLVEVMKPLAESQSYIKEFRKTLPSDNIWWASGDFRKKPYTWRTLVGAHAVYLQEMRGVGGSIDGSVKWLEGIKPSPESKDRIIINRTGRYRNHLFPWADIVKFYKHRLMFVGMEHEWREFCGHFGYVGFRPTANMLDVAQLLAGSRLFIGNQSCVNAVAEGLKHPLIQETSMETPDCVFPRANAAHVCDGTCVLPGFDGDADLLVRPLAVAIKRMDTKTVPPGKMVGGRRTQAGWIIDLPNGPREINMHFGVILSIARQHGLTREDVLEQNAMWNYDYFFSQTNESDLASARNAMTRMGITTNHPTP